MVVVLSIGSILYASAKNLDEHCEYLLDKKGCRVSYRQVLTSLVDRAVEIDDQAVLKLINFDIHGNPKVMKENYESILKKFAITVSFENLLSKCSFGYKIPELEEERGLPTFQMTHDVVHGLYLVMSNIEGYFYAQQAAEEKYRRQQLQLHREELDRDEPISKAMSNQPQKIGRRPNKHYGGRNSRSRIAGIPKK